MRFLLVGVSNLLLTYIVYLFALMAVRPAAAMLLASAVGIVYSSITSINFVFSRAIRVPVLLAMASYYVVYSVVSAVLVELVARHTGIPAPFAPLPVLCVTVPVHFVCSRFLALRLGPVRREFS